MAKMYQTQFAARVAKSFVASDMTQSGHSLTVAEYVVDIFDFMRHRSLGARFGGDLGKSVVIVVLVLDNLAAGNVCLLGTVAFVVVDVVPGAVRGNQVVGADGVAGYRAVAVGIVRVGFIGGEAVVCG